VWKAVKNKADKARIAETDKKKRYKKKERKSLVNQQWRKKWK